MDSSSYKWIEYKNATCYSYVINHFTNNRFYIGDYKLGERVDISVSNEILMSSLIKELNAMRFKVCMVEKNYVLKPNEVLICIVREDAGIGYYHLYKREFGGNWSHKKPNELPVYLNDSIEDDIENNLEAGYKMLHYFVINKNSDFQIE